jgi:hypothetical protein
MTRCLQGLVVLLFALLVAPAHADPGGRVAVDLDLGGPIGVDARSFAIGAAARFGWRFDLGPVWLQPEVGGGYVAFVGSDSYWWTATRYPAARAGRVTGGVRLGGEGLIARVIEPALFGHAGCGWITQASGYDLLRGPTFDAGVALDAKLTRRFSVGLQSAFNVVAAPAPSEAPYLGPATVRWLSYGVHAEARF